MALYGLVIFNVVMFLWTGWRAGAAALQQQTLTWSGGDFAAECPLTMELMRRAGQYVRESVVAVKAVSYNDDILLLTPRLKRGVPASVCQLHSGGGAGAVLSAYPELRAHTEGDCAAIQNAVDFYLDHLGTLWVLDSGAVDTLRDPRCTCPPKLLAVSLHRRRVTLTLDLSDVAESTSVLTGLVVEYGFGGKAYAYITDQSQSSVLVYDVRGGSGSRALLPLPACRLQLALCRRAPAHRAALLLACRARPPVYRVDTARLRRGDSVGTVAELSDMTVPVTFLGSDPAAQTVYVTLDNSSDVTAWTPGVRARTVHRGAACCVRAASVAPADRRRLLLLETNFGDFLADSVGTGTFHRLTFIPKV